MENCADIVFPNTTYPCNRVSCGREWVTDNWSRCSVSCGVGVQKRYIFCGSIAENLNPAECSASPPATTRVCSQQNCPPNACVDKISLCTRGATERTCRYRGYQFMCCATCSKFQTWNVFELFLSNNWHKYILRKAIEAFHIIFCVFM